MAVTDFEISVEGRSDKGKGACGRVRATGMLPGIMYAHGMESVQVKISDREFNRLARLAGTSQVFKIADKSGKFTGRSAIVKEIQQDHVKNRVLHVDLQLLRDDEEITLDVRLSFIGESPGVKVDGGVLTVSAHALSVSCLPKFIPQLLTVDISGLQLGGSLHASDVVLPEGVVLSGDPGETIASVVAPRSIVEETAAATPADGVAPAEGGAATAEGGAAAPAADAKAAEAKAKK